ncbi:response regulator receiver protein [Olivibacter sp. XZL3]|uniref:response regulator receiver protein n=1 Tax=Olivibacter sp. XZL3 TaxID=1735116 RepID=UPI001066934F|nr:response regulator receiver protein [Olivibacter sp. XZL3]
MKEKEIMVVCTHPDVLSTILRLVNSRLQWNATGASDFKEAYELGRKQLFDLVLIGAGLSDEEEAALISELGEAKCIRHYGGGSGLLYAEIEGALSHA